MGIWIRSQDKELIINCYALEIDLGDGKSICSNGYVLGTYSTKEKALKVLDMIQEFIKNMYVGIGGYMGKPFQMPDDEDIEEE